MGNHTWIAVLTAGWLIACGGSTQVTRDPDAPASGDIEGAGAAGAPGRPTGGAGAPMASAGAPTGGGGAPAGARVHLGPGSWDVTASITSQPTTMSLCHDLDFSLTVDGTTMTLGVGGQLVTAPVKISDDAYVATSVDLNIGSCRNNSGARLFASELRLQGIDSDGDGEADRLEATATLAATDVLTLGIGAPAHVVPSIVLIAVPDHSNPTLEIDAGPVIDLNPLDGLSLRASEPLESASALSLTGTSSVPLPALVPDPAVPRVATGFGPSRVLPFGGTWHFAGAARDLAGNPLKYDPAQTFSTLADPGVLAQDGFESSLSGVLGTAERVTSRGAIPALSGAQSLWLEAGNGPPGTIIHLQRLANQKNLHFVVRAFSTQEAYVHAEKIVRAGAVGGAQVTVTRTTLPNKPVSASGDEQLPWVSGVLQFDAVLDGPGTDVVLNISDSRCVEDPSCNSRASWLIDDLKVE